MPWKETEAKSIIKRIWKSPRRKGNQIVESMFDDLKVISPIKSQ